MQSVEMGQRISEQPPSLTLKMLVSYNESKGWPISVKSIQSTEQENQSKGKGRRGNAAGEEKKCEKITYPDANSSSHPEYTQHFTTQEQKPWPFPASPQVRHLHRQHSKTLSLGQFLQLSSWELLAHRSLSNQWMVPLDIHTVPVKACTLLSL